MDKVTRNIRIGMWIFTIIFAIAVIAGLIYVVKDYGPPPGHSPIEQTK